jgi:hypothetical protein
MKSHGLARPLMPPFAGCYRKITPTQPRPLTDEERENIRAALIMETMEFESDQPQEFADD